MICSKAGCGSDGIVQRLHVARADNADAGVVRRLLLGLHGVCKQDTNALLVVRLDDRKAVLGTVTACVLHGLSANDGWSSKAGLLDGRMFGA